MSDLIRTEHNNGVVTYRSPLLSDAGVPHGFTTRIGGLSPAPYASLNLASLVSDQDADANTNVAENFRRVRRAMGCERHIRVQVNQVHGCHVWRPPAEPVRPVDAPRADAVVTDRDGQLLMVRVADCVPILISTEDGRVVSAVHAGWRGLVAGVIEASLNEVVSVSGTDMSTLLIAVGPCISVEHFEVGPEVVEVFENVGLADAVVEREAWEKPHIDLPRAVARRLKQSGVTPGRIDMSTQCTFGNAEDFFSHRRDQGRTGRQAAMIAVKAGGSTPSQ